MNQNIQQHVLVMFVIVSREKPLLYQGSENRCLKRAPLSFVDNYIVTTCTLEQFTHKSNDTKHENLFQPNTVSIEAAYTNRTRPKFLSKGAKSYSVEFFVTLKITFSI